MPLALRAGMGAGAEPGRADLLRVFVERAGAIPGFFRLERLAARLKFFR